MGQTPAAGATGQAVTSRAVVSFNEAIQPSSVLFTLVDSSKNPVPATISYNSSSYSVTLTPNAYLSTAQTYTATLSGATDLSGNVMSGSLSWSFSTGSMTVGAPTLDANGVESYVVTSTFQGPQSMTIRVLEPTSPAPGRPHRLLYVLPVEIGVTSLTSNYSDGLEELRLAGVPNQYNMTLVAPSFNYMPWYGDNVTNSQHLMESFVLNDLMPFGDTFAKGTEILPRLAIGFSKSGNGVLLLILRHPNVFSGVAAWDSPAQLNNLNTFAPDLQTNFGTQANFNTYNIPSLIVSGGAAFTQQNRLWVSGDQGLYTADMVQLDSQLTAAGIPHTFIAGGTRPHSWNSGWLPGAITGLDAVSIVRSNGQPGGVLASGATQTTLTLNTDQKATCRYATVAGTPYASMPYLFATTGGTSQSTPVTGLTNGGIYNYFVRCQDSLGNSNPEDFAIIFSVAQPGDTTPPVRSNGQPTGVLPAGTTQTTLSLTTNENAICRYATVAGTAFGAMANTFSSTGGTTQSTTITGLANGGTYSYDVRCQDASGNADPDDFTISFSTVVSDPASSSFVGVENPLSEGGMWTTAGAWASMAKNNGAYGATTNLAALAKPVVSSDQFSEITFDQNLGSASWVGVTTRIQGAGKGSGYLAIAYNGAVQLFRVDDTGTLNWTQLASANVDITVAPRDLRLESQGASHRVYFNGTQLINYTESSPVYTGGQPGIADYQNVTTAKILTFTGGSLSGSGGSGSGPRTTPPVRSNGQPSGVIAGGTTQTNISLSTDENATCRYATVAGTAYESMVNTFTATGAMTHSTPVSGLVSGGSYTYYVRCQDALGNTNANDYAISFSLGVTGTDPESSSFVGAENPLSEQGLWIKPGAWAAMAKNNGAYGTATNMASLATPAMNPDQFAEITFDQNLGTTSWVGVTTRVQSASKGSCYLAIAYNGGVRLYRTDDTGTLNWTQLAGANVDITVAPRDLRLESQGSTHRVYFNGVQLISYTESAPLYTTGQPGVAAYSNAATAKILTFTGGSLNGSGPRTTPPVRYNGQPTGVLTAGTTQTNLSLTTDENATCRYAAVAGTAYASMVSTFSTTGGTTQSTPVSGLVSGATYNYYVRCQDALGNTNADDFAITFTVGVTGTDPASSSFVGVENPLSEGGLWIKPGAWAAMAKNNGAYGTATNMASLATPMVSADQFSEITFDQNLGTASWVGVTTRVQSASNGGCYLAIAYNGGVWLYRTDDTGTLNWTQLAGANVDITAAPRDLRLESQGATHRVYFNGVQLINYTESAPVYTTGQPGVAAYQNASTAKILTFTGGSLSGSRQPAISSANSATFTAGTAGSFAITTTGTPTPSVAETGTLPSGITFQDNGNGTATLGGTPLSGSGGTYALTITASNGVGTNASQSFTLTVNPPTVVVSSVSLSPVSVTGGASSTGTVTLSSAAPTGGAVVTLTSNNTAAATVPASVTVAAGATSATFTATTVAVGTTTAVTISGTYNGTQGATLTVNAPTVVVSSVSLSPASVTGGASSTGTVTLSGAAPTGGAAVTLTSSNTAAATVPASVTVAAGATSATFTATTVAVGTTTAVTISGTYNGTQGATLTVNAPTVVVSSVTLSPASVTGGASSTGTVTLSGAAPTGGAAVTLTSSNTAAATVPASVTVAAGATSATFTATTVAVGTTTAVTISGTYNGTQGATLTVNAPTVVVSSVTLSPASVTGGASSTGTVTLSGAAPTGGAAVTLTSSNTAAATVPASVTVAAGATSATFTATTVAVGTTTAVTISGTYNGTQGATLTVNAPTVSSVSVSPAAVTGGVSSTGTVTLSSAAPTGGAVVTLTSNNTAAATVPASVTVAAGARSATFTATTVAVGTTTAVTISGTYNGTQGATLTVNPPAVSSVSVSPAAVTGGVPSTGTVTLSSAAPTGGAVVTLTSNNTAAATVPASVTVAAGATSATFTVTTAPVAANATVSISALFNGTTKSANLTVKAPIPSGLTFSPTSVTGGTSSTGTVTLSGAAPAGGAAVTLTSSNTAAATVPGSVTVAAGATSTTFTVTTTPVAANGAVSISAVLNGTTKSTNLTVNAPAPSGVTLNPSSVTGGTASTGTVTLNGAAPAGGAAVTLGSNNTAAATVPGSVTVAAGATSATFTIATAPVAANATVSISALFNGTTKSANLAVKAPIPSSVTLNPTSVQRRGLVNGYGNLERRGSSGRGISDPDKQQYRGGDGAGECDGGGGSDKRDVHDHDIYADGQQDGEHFRQAQQHHGIRYVDSNALTSPQFNAASGPIAATRKNT